MMTQQQVIALLQQLEQQHPEAFKRNYLFYSLLKTKGILDDIKEIIPWLLASIIFISSMLALTDYLPQFWENLNQFQYMGMSILCIMLVMRIYLPFVIWQIKHSSNALYQHLKHTPIKLSIVIILQAINLLYIESSILQYVLFFFALSFGFVRLYKENMFLDETTLEQHYYLQQIRRATLWSYKKTQRLNFKIKFMSNNNDTSLKNQYEYFQSLHKSLKNYEDKMYKTYKHPDIESYMDHIE